MRWLCALLSAVAAKLSSFVPRVFVAVLIARHPEGYEELLTRLCKVASELDIYVEEDEDRSILGLAEGLATFFETLVYDRASGEVLIGLPQPLHLSLLAAQPGPPAASSSGTSPTAEAAIGGSWSSPKAPATPTER